MLRIERFSFWFISEINKIFNQIFQIFIFPFESLFFISNRISTENYFEEKKKTKVEKKSILLLNNVILSPSKSIHSTVQICFPSNELPSEKKQKRFSLFIKISFETFSHRTFWTIFIKWFSSHRSKTKICSQRKIQKIFSTTFQ